MDIEKEKADFIQNHRDDLAELFEEYTNGANYNGDIAGFPEWMLRKLGFYDQVTATPSAEPEREKGISTGILIARVMFVGITGLLLLWGGFSFTAIGIR
jgi:hypothetical protein